MCEIPEFEICFQFNIHIFFLDGENIAKPIYRSKNNFMIDGKKKNNLYLNIFEGHQLYPKYKYIL